jgi:hemolysin activation/secretion protein
MAVSRSFAPLTGLAMGAALLAAPAARAETPLPSTVEPGRHQGGPELPRPEFELTIPSPKRTPLSRDVDSLRFAVRELSVEGSTVFARSQLEDLARPLVGTEATLSELLAVADRIEAMYREAGYLMTRAFVPAQRTKDGGFRIQVVEGYVSAVAVNGVDEATAARLRAVVAPVLDQRPLRTDTMERALLLLNDLPGVKASGLLKPARDTGAAEMVITAEARPFTATASIDNRSSRYDGTWSASSDFAVHSLAGLGETLTAGITALPGDNKKRGLRAGWVQPVGTDGLKLSALWDYTRTHSGFSLSDYSVFSTSVTAQARASYPLLRTRAHTVTVDAGLAAKSATVDMEQALYTRDRWRTFDARLTWQHSGWASGADTVSVGVTQGIPLAGANRSSDQPISRAEAEPGFTKLTVDAGRLQALAPGWDLYTGLSGQYAFDKLFASEEFALGGTTYGHGFDPSALVGDHGIGATASLRRDISSLTPAFKATSIYTFYDWGMVWAPTERREQGLASVGLGIRVALNDDLDGNVEAAHRLYGADDTTAGRGVARIYLSLSGRF